MSNPQKRKGDAAEREVLDRVLAAGFPDAVRTRPGRRDDEGDVHCDRASRYVLQVKAVAAYSWRTWLTELAAQKKAAKAEHAALVVRRQGAGGRPPIHLAVMELDDMLALMKAAQGRKEDG